jgi:hypothetical protein
MEQRHVVISPGITNRGPFSNAEEVSKISHQGERYIPLNVAGGDLSVLSVKSQEIPAESQVNVGPATFRGIFTHSQHAPTPCFLLLFPDFFAFL